MFWYWSVVKLTHGELCEMVSPVDTIDSFTSGTSWYSFLSRLEIDWQMLCLNKWKKKEKKKTLVTSKVYFVFIYKWQLFYYQIQNVIKDLRRILTFLMLCNAWLTLVNHLHFKYTHIHIYPYCVYVWVFPLYWKVMEDANASVVCLLLIRNKIFIKIS